MPNLFEHRCCGETIDADFDFGLSSPSHYTGEQEPGGTIKITRRRDGKGARYTRDELGKIMGSTMFFGTDAEEGYKRAFKLAHNPTSWPSEGGVIKLWRDIPTHSLEPFFEQTPTLPRDLPNNYHKKMEQYFRLYQAGRRHILTPLYDGTLPGYCRHGGGTDCECWAMFYMEYGLFPREVSNHKIPVSSLVSRPGWEEAWGIAVRLQASFGWPYRGSPAVFSDLVRNARIAWAHLGKSEDEPKLSGPQGGRRTDNAIIYLPTTGSTSVGSVHVSKRRVLPLNLTREDAIAILGLTRRKAASVKMINYHWQVAAFRHHPDLGGNEEDMVRVNVARDKLMACCGAVADRCGVAADE